MKDIRANLTGNFALMREMNTAIILTCLRQNAPISRSEIAEKTQLTPATVSRITGKLIANDFIEEKGYGHSQGGRRPILLELNAQAALVIGIAIEVSSIIGVIIDLKGKVLLQKRIDFQGKLNKEELLTYLREIISELLKWEKQERIIGLGVGIHGLVDFEQGISIYPPAFKWSNLPLAEILEKEFKLPTLVDNNDRVLALREHLFGKTKESKNFIYLKVGEGIGSGIYINGDIYRGASQMAGEIGHTTVEQDGPLCRCGNYGCLESMASIPAIINKTIKLLKQGAKSKIYKLVEGNLELIDLDIIIKAAKNNDILAQQILQETGRYLGIAIANIINVLNFDIVVIGGEINKGDKFILESIKETVKIRALTYPAQNVKIIQSSLGEVGVAIGAGTLLLESVFKLDKFNLEKKFIDLEMNI